MRGRPRSSTLTIEYRIGDCVEVMKEYPENHFDACVTDPPYGLEFMGKEWDRLWDAREHGGTPDHYVGTDGAHREHGRGRPGPIYEAGVQAQEWHQLWATELLRVLKPGAHALVFGGTRTYHRLVCALEDAGFEIRDCLMWIYGSGFPKSLDVSKAIDKAAGAEREVIGRAYEPTGTNPNPMDWGKENNPTKGIITAPATLSAKKWSGWGTALKPAYEPIVLARKPLDGTVAQNVLKYGTGGLNIDATRIEYGSEQDFQTTVKGVQAMYDNERDKKNTQGWKRPWNDTNPRTDAKASTSPQGRWPANVILDDEAGKLLDAQSGETNRGHYPKIGNVGGEDRRVYSGGWDSIEGEERYTEQI